MQGLECTTVASLPAKHPSCSAGSCERYAAALLLRWLAATLYGLVLSVVMMCRLCGTLWADMPVSPDYACVTLLQPPSVRIEMDNRHGMQRISSSTG